MTWFKVDDSFYDHPKIFDAPDCALALWIRAGCWSARSLKDGFVPANLPARLCDDPDNAVRALVDRGLWKKVRGGYQFHDWHEYQPSAADVKELRAKRAEAGKRGGQAKAAKQAATKPLASASQVGKQNAAPSRPDPSYTNGSVDRPLQPVVGGPADDDQSLDMVNDRIEGRIIEILAEKTGRTVDRAWASKIRSDLLRDREVTNPLGFIVSCVRGDPEKYLPAVGAPYDQPPPSLPAVPPVVAKTAAMIAREQFPNLRNRTTPPARETPQ